MRGLRNVRVLTKGLERVCTSKEREGGGGGLGQVWAEIIWVSLSLAALEEGGRGSGRRDLETIKGPSSCLSACPPASSGEERRGRRGRSLIAVQSDAALKARDVSRKHQMRRAACSVRCDTAAAQRGSSSGV